MEETMKKAREADENLARGSKPITSPIEISDSNDGGTEIQINQELGFDFGFHEEGEVKKGLFEDFDIFFEDEESSGSHHSTSKPKKKKKKKKNVSRK